MSTNDTMDDAAGDELSNWLSASTNGEISIEDIDEIFVRQQPVIVSSLSIFWFLAIQGRFIDHPENLESFQSQSTEPAIEVGKS